jgi:hypothetical protein
MRQRGIRMTLSVLEVFTAVFALLGGIALLTGAFAHSIPQAWLQGTPFQDFTIPGLTLAVVIGGGMLVAAVATVVIRRAWAVLVSLSMGIALIGFEIVEAFTLDAHAIHDPGFGTMLGLQLISGAVGVVISGLAAYVWVLEFRPLHPSIKAGGAVG